MTHFFALIASIALTGMVFFLSTSSNLDTKNIQRKISDSAIESNFSELQDTYNRIFSYGKQLTEDNWMELYSRYGRVPQIEEGELSFHQRDGLSYFCIQYSDAVTFSLDYNDVLRIDNCENLHSFSEINNSHGIAMIVKGSIYKEADIIDD